MPRKPNGNTDGDKPRPARPMRETDDGEVYSFTTLHEEPDWNASELDFSSEEWVCPATDSKGHSQRETVRVPPVMHRAIEVLIASKQFPYKTPGDLIRHAVYRHLFFCHRRAAQVPRHLLSVCEAVITQMRDEQQLMTMRSTIEQIVKTIAQHASDGNVVMVRTIIAQVYSMLEQIDKNSAWKKRFKLEFAEKCQTYYSVLRQTTEEAQQTLKASPYSLSGLPPRPDPMD